MVRSSEIYPSVELLSRLHFGASWHRDGGCRGHAWEGYPQIWNNQLRHIGQDYRQGLNHLFIFLYESVAPNAADSSPCYFFFVDRISLFFSRTRLLLFPSICGILLGSFLSGLKHLLCCFLWPFRGSRFSISTNGSSGV